MYSRCWQRESLHISQNSDTDWWNSCQVTSQVEAFVAIHLKSVVSHSFLVLILLIISCGSSTTTGGDQCHWAIFNTSVYSSFNTRLEFGWVSWGFSLLSLQAYSLVHILHLNSFSLLVQGAIGMLLCAFRWCLLLCLRILDFDNFVVDYGLISFFLMRFSLVWLNIH